jgi:hypothetical protein
MPIMSNGRVISYENRSRWQERAVLCSQVALTPRTSRRAAMKFGSDLMPIDNLSQRRDRNRDLVVGEKPSIRSGLRLLHCYLHCCQQPSRSAIVENFTAGPPHDV